VDDAVTDVFPFDNDILTLPLSAPAV